MAHLWHETEKETLSQGMDDMDPESDVEQLRLLPPDERRKALRRLRNRESARRVRARRVAEMNTMEEQSMSLQDENAGLRTHVEQLQAHIQSMTVKIYEVTAKYEATVAENVRLKMDRQQWQHQQLQQQVQQNSAPHTTCAWPVKPDQGMNSLGLNPVQHLQQLARMGADAPMKALHGIDEVTWLIQQHKRRAEAAQARERQACGSGSGVSCHSHHRTPSPNISSATPMPPQECSMSAGTDASMHSASAPLPMPLSASDSLKIMPPSTCAWPYGTLQLPADYPIRDAGIAKRQSAPGPGPSAAMQLPQCGSATGAGAGAQPYDNRSNSAQHHSMPLPAFSGAFAPAGASNFPPYAQIGGLKLSQLQLSTHSGRTNATSAMSSSPIGLVSPLSDQPWGAGLAMPPAAALHNLCMDDAFILSEDLDDIIVPQDL